MLQRHNCSKLFITFNKNTESPDLTLSGTQPHDSNWLPSETVEHELVRFHIIIATKTQHNKIMLPFPRFTAWNVYSQCEFAWQWRHISFITSNIAGNSPVRSGWQQKEIPKLCLTGGWINMKMSSYQYRKSHCGDKTIVDRLISTMGFPILVRWHLYIESGPWSLWGWSTGNRWTPRKRLIWGKHGHAMTWHGVSRNDVKFWPCA